MPRFDLMLSTLLISFLIMSLVPKGTASDPPAEQNWRALDSVSIGLMLAQVAVPADTVRAGEAFITNLPDSLGEKVVSHYSGIALPARSWLVNRTFFWQTTNSDRGASAFWFRAVLEDATTDSLAIDVFVQ